MSLTMPSELKWLEWVVGSDWPDGDEDRLRTCAQAWAAVATEVRQLVPVARLAGAEAAAAVDGEVAFALESYWQRFATDDHSHFEHLAGACDELARLCETTALEVEYAKYQFILALIALAITILVLLASAAETFGASTAGIPVAELATQSVVRAIALRLLNAITTGAATNVAMDLAAQAVQALQGHRHDWDSAKTAGAAESGAIFGAVAGGVHLAGQRYAPELANTWGGRLAEGTVTGAAGAELTALATGVPLSITDFVKSTTAGLAQTAAEAAHPSRTRPIEDLPVDGSVADKVELLLASTPDAPTRPSTLEGDGQPPPLPVSDTESLTLVRDNLHRTRAGYAFYPAGDGTLGFAAAVRRQPGYITLDVHGSSAGFHVDGRLLTPDQFATALRTMAAEGTVQLPDGVRYRLASCDTAAGADPPAARLARALGAEVSAPTERLWTTFDGREVVTSAELSGGRWVPKHPADGYWRTFSPEPEGGVEARHTLEHELAGSGRSITDLVREAPSLTHLLESGVRPDEIARDADPATLRRLAPGLDERGVEDLGRFLGDDRVRDALRRSWEVPAQSGGGTLAGALLRGLIDAPDLVRVMRDSDILMHSLTQRPDTIESLLRHPRAIDVLADVAAEVRERGVDAVLADGVPPPAPTPLTGWQQALSRSIGPRAGRETTQPGFVRRRRRDPAYVEGYLHDLYHKASAAQRQLTELVDAVADRTGGQASYRTRPKRWQRALDKLAALGGDASRLTDLAAGTIQYETLTELYRGLSEIHRHPGARIVFYHDRFLHPLDNGYRDIQLKLRMPGGHVVELQLHLRRIREVADWEHALFEVRRDLGALAGPGGMSGEARAIANGLLNRAQGHFSDAIGG
jgi:hypothetical protein